MDKLIPTLVVGLVILVALGLMALGWRNRRRRQSAVSGRLALPPEDLGEVLLDLSDSLYVATTVAEQPLERVVVAPLGFRARASITVATAGIRLDLDGGIVGFIPRTDLLGVGLATWTIDRAVEQDGLVVVRWRLGETPVDSYLRADDPNALLHAIEQLAPTPLGQESA